MIKAFRGGASNRVWSSDPGPVSLAGRGKSVHLSFGMPSKGGGETIVRLEISPDSFAELVQAMLKTDEAAALRAIAKALQGRDVTIKAGRDVEIQVGAAS